MGKQILLEQQHTSGQRYTALQDARNAIEDQIRDISYHMGMEISYAENINEIDQGEKDPFFFKEIFESAVRYHLLQDVRKETEVQLQDLEDAMAKEWDYLEGINSLLEKCALNGL